MFEKNALNSKLLNWKLFSLVLSLEKFIAAPRFFKIIFFFFFFSRTIGNWNKLPENVVCGSGVRFDTALKCYLRGDIENGVSRVAVTLFLSIIIIIILLLLLLVAAHCNV